MRCHDDRNQPRGANRPEARCRLQNPDDGVLLRLSKEIGLRLLLLFQQEVEMIVEASHSRLRAGAQLIPPLLSVADTVDVHTGDQDAA